MYINKKKFKWIFLISTLIILCLCMISVLNLFYTNNEVNAIKNLSSVTDVGELLLKNYPTSEGNKTFNGDKLELLYKSLTGIATYEEVKRLASATLNSDNFRTFNGGSDITVTINGLIWNVTYLSENRDGDPILTLWLANSKQLPLYYRTATWNDYGDDSNGAYPANMYGTSKMRAKTLNNGGKYATSLGDMSTGEVEQDADNPFAIYTMDDIDGSLTSFIDTPSNVLWQETVSAKNNNFAANGANYSYNFNNDAYSTTMSDIYNSPTKSYQLKTGYTTWKDDKIWLPAMAETGWSQQNKDNYRGLWKTNDNQRGNDNDTDVSNAKSWLRSSDDFFYSNVYTLTEDGVTYSSCSASKTCAVRPAFHLNLRKAKEAASAVKPQKKGDIIKYYDNGNLLNFEMDKVNSNLVDIQVVAKDMDGNDIIAPAYSVTGGILSFRAGSVGKYTVQVTPKSGECWNDGSANTLEFDYKILYSVTPMRIKTSVSGLVYKGGKLYLEVENYDEDFMTVTMSSGAGFGIIPAGESNAGKHAFWAINAAKGYRATVSLKNTDYMEWTDKTVLPKSDLTFDISPKALTVMSSVLWSTQVYTGKDYQVNYDCCDVDIGKLRFEAYYTGGGITAETKTDDPVVSSTDKKLTVRLPQLSNKGTYKYILKLVDSIPANSNYTLTYDNNFTVGNKQINLTNSDIVWRYANTNIDGGAYRTIEQNDLDANDILNLDYNGAEYTFDVNLLAFNEDIRNSIECEYLGDIRKTDVDAGGATYSVILKIKAKDGNPSIDIGTPTFTLKWKINKIKFDFSNVKWNYDATNPYKYNENLQSVELQGLPAELQNCVKYGGNSGVDVRKYHAIAQSITITDVKLRNNYVLPIIKDTSTYIYNGVGNDVEWELDWDIVSGVLNLEWGNTVEKDDSNGKTFEYPIVSETYKDYVKCYEYYRENDFINGSAAGAPIMLDDITVIPEKEERYWAVAILSDFYTGKYDISELTKSILFTVGTYKKEIVIKMSEKEFIYDSQPHGSEWTVENGTLRMIEASYYAIEEDGSETLLDSAPINAGNYMVRFEVANEYESVYEMGVKRIKYEIKAAKIKAEWESEGKKPELKGLGEKEKEKIEYEYRDEQGNAVEESELENGKTYKVIAKIKSEHAGNYEFVDLQGNVLEKPSESGEYEFEYNDGSEEPGNPNDPNNPEKPGKPGEGSEILEELLKKVKEMPLWQLIASVISLILAIIFMSKTASYDNKRRKLNKKADKLNTLYAGTYLGIATTVWTAIAWVLMCFAVISLIMMIVAKHRYVKAADNYEDVFEEYQQKKEEKKEENLRIMFMGMGNNGMAQGMPQGGYVVQQGLGIDDMRGLISEAVTALLPGMQQALPQQASANDELVQKLLEKTTKNEDTMQKLIKKMAEQPAERIVEREVAASVSDELLEKLVNKLHPVADDETLLKVVNHTEQNNETIKQLLKNQEMLMQKILELSAQNNAGNTQVVEKIVEKPVEKIVEVPVEKIIEKEVVKEVKVEVPVEQIVEKVVEKAVPVAAAPKAKKEVAPRLTLDEAYEKLSKQQKKFFDGLREYAMKKEKCKEKKSTYNILLGQSTVNPLVKLTIKKDVTVALFKMEDEYLKDIRRNASNDGAKIKVKETEIAIGDAQAYSAAKEMIDLREDQIERYQDFLKEQRALTKR